MSWKNLLKIFTVGTFIRCWLITSNYKSLIANRIEVSTPLNSWKRAVEGIHLIKMNLNPYDGDLFHEPPIHLMAYKALFDLCGEHLYIFFIFCDIITAYVLYVVGRKHIENLQKHTKLDPEKDLSAIPIYAAAAYLFNPYCIFNCIGCTTTVFSNLFISLFLLGLIKSNILLSTLSLAVCISQNFYPILLLSPLFLQFWYKENSLSKAVTAVMMVCSFCWLLLQSSYYLFNNWGFLENTYGFILSVPDLRPNIGLFWYFFIEMFEHFRRLFIYSFQINVTILYLIPLSISFRKEPFLLSTGLLSLISIFKSYPCLGDVGFMLALMPFWKFLFKNVQQAFIIATCLFVSTVLAPTVWHLWIYSGSANANFYFGVTLAFASGQIFLITNVLFAYMKHRFTTIHGNIKRVDGKRVNLVLE